MADLSAAEILRAAAAKLRAPLPGPYAMVPRVVQGDSETQSALAWCEDHTRWAHPGRTHLDPPSPPEDAESLACWNCDIAELVHPALATLIRDLLAGREQFAAWLEHCASQAESMTHPEHFGRCDEPSSVRQALSAAKAILGEVTNAG